MVSIEGTIEGHPLTNIYEAHTGANVPGARGHRMKNWLAANIWGRAGVEYAHRAGIACPAYVVTAYGDRARELSAALGVPTEPWGNGDVMLPGVAIVAYAGEIKRVWR